MFLGQGLFIILIKLNSNAIKSNRQIRHLSQLEQLLPKATQRLSKRMVKACQKRLPKVKAIRKPLPGSFNVDGSVIIINYYFDTVINSLNHVVNDQYNGHRYAQIKADLRSLMMSINHSNKHLIATQKGKLILLKLVKALKTSAHYNNLHQTINNVVHVISQCLVLDRTAYREFHFLNQRFNRTHQ